MRVFSKVVSLIFIVALFTVVLLFSSCSKLPDEVTSDNTNPSTSLEKETVENTRSTSTTSATVTYNTANNVLEVLWATSTSGTFRVYRRVAGRYELLGKTSTTRFTLNSVYANFVWNTELIEVRRVTNTGEMVVHSVPRDRFRITYNSPKLTSSVMYKLFIRSFFDSNGDGIGDFTGVSQKVDYLKKLGVDTIWFLPFNTSKSYHGYDVENYYNVEPDYGSFADLEEMIKTLAYNGINVIMDLVVNHTSDTHPWFLDAIEKTTSSKYWNYYIMSLTPPSNRAHWHYKINSKGQQVWYFGLFDSSMPDLNFDNPAVRQEIRNIIDFWLLVGVSGFRLDAVKHYYGWSWDDGVTQSAQVAKELESYIRSKVPNALVVSEVYSGDPGTLSSFAPMPVFNFTFMFNVKNSYEGRDNLLRDSISWLNQTGYNLPVWHYPFLDNHDLDRLISFLLDSKYSGNVTEAIKQYLVLNALLLSLHGMPAIYYGNEIGLRGWKWNSEPWDIPVREPMQWYASQTGRGQTNWTLSVYRTLGIKFGNALNDGAIYDDPYDKVSVEEQESGFSILNFFRQFIKLRNDYPAMAFGNIQIERDWKNLIVVRRATSNQEVLLLFNLDPRWPNTYRVPAGFRWVWYAFFNDTNFTFGPRSEQPLSRETDWTVNPRQIYVFVRNK